MSDPRYEIADWSAPAMGGTLAVAVAVDPESVGSAARAVERTGRRVTAWADRLTRFRADSDLARLNADASTAVHVRPTLGSALAWAQTACAASAGVVDVTLLDARLAAETGQSRPADEIRSHAADWSIECSRATRPGQPRAGRPLRPRRRGQGLAGRPRQLAAARWPGCFVDADGDIALAATAGVEWLIDVVDPRSDDGTAAGDAPFRRHRRLAADRCGVATSGTSVHRWPHGRRVDRATT